MGLRPKVAIQVNSALGLIAQGGPATCAIIGTAQWGPMDTVQDLTNFNEGLNIFKEDKSGTDLSLIKGLDLLYSNGAGNVKAIRIEDGTAAKASLTLLGGGTSGIDVFGKYKGSYGNNIMVAVTNNSANPTYVDLEITDGAFTETYNNGGIGYSSNVSIVSEVNSESLLVTTVSSGATLISTLTQTNLTGGLDGTSGLAQADFTDILDNQLYSEDYNILVIPGQTGDSFHTAVVGRLNSRAANDDKYSVYFSGVAIDETIPTIQARTASGRRFALIAPAVKYTNRATGDEQTLNGSYLACAYAGITALEWPEVSATHKTLNIGGLNVDSSIGKEYYNNSEVETLLKARTVPVTKIAGQIQAARAVTRNSSTTEVWFEQNIVDIVDYVKEQVIVALNPYIGKPNLERVRTVMAKNIDGILEQNKLDEVITAYLATEVTVGTSNDTVNVSMVIKPTFLVNFINVTLTLDNVSQ
jgi:hypothetical protein